MEQHEQKLTVHRSSACSHADASQLCASYGSVSRSSDLLAFNASVVPREMNLEPPERFRRRPRRKETRTHLSKYMDVPTATDRRATALC